MQSEQKQHNNPLNVYELEDHFSIDSNLLNSETINSSLYRLASLDAYRKYKTNFKIVNIRLSLNTSNSTVLYSFTTSDPSVVAIHESLQKERETNEISLPTERFKTRIEKEGSRVKFEKLCMTYRDPDTQRVYFRTHTGKVYDNHYSLGCFLEKRPDEIPTIDIDCDHVFKTIEQQTRSGDEEITVSNICIKCNADKKNLRSMPKLVKRDQLEVLAKLLNVLTDREFDYKESQTVTHLFSMA
ncbi:late expression factor 5 [Helicoverpa zea nudivirus 2]|uniref:Late expression factor 5 n=1 Tax=Helicoverpa zea nudivirus 2 TaxID=1128424 RepID=G9I066_HZNV2|nr:orf40 gene product [Helicoverpa zea nudivirus 2]AEW69589.1 late expression factor 5 [Helicoverpa zea nudivirus 2]